MADPVTLEFLSEQQERILRELGAIRDDMRVLTALTMRVDNSYARLDSNHSMLLSEMREIRQELREMHSQHMRVADRLARLEEKSEPT
jgi:chromosome segregation ATPase